MHLTWHTGWADLKYIGGYSDYVYKQVTDFDRAARDFYDYTPVTAAGVPSTRSVRIWGHSATHYQEHKQYYSNELNLTSTKEGPWQWIVGLYQFNENSRQPSGVLNARKLPANSAYAHCAILMCVLYLGPTHWASHG